jgi:hypothetical protein
MDKAVLVDHDLEEGGRLLRALDGAGVPVVAALWYYVDEPGVWRYMLASPLVDEKGPRKTYARIDKVRASTLPPPDITLDQIVAASPGSPLIAGLRIHAGTAGAPYVGGVWLSRAVVGEEWIEKSYIYRAERLIGASGETRMEFAVRAPDRRSWLRRDGKITTDEAGRTVKVEIENRPLEQPTRRNGINAAFYVFQNVVEKGGKKYGDVERWAVQDGRLRTAYRVATGVEMKD